MSGLIPPVSPAGSHDTAPASDVRVKRAAEDFEAILLGQLLKGLRRTVPQGDEVSSTRQMYNEMFDEALATEIAHRGGIGLADMIRAYVSRTEQPGREGQR